MWSGITFLPALFIDYNHSLLSQQLNVREDSRSRYSGRTELANRFSLTNVTFLLLTLR